MRSPPVGWPRSSRPARTPRSGNLIPPEQSHATKSCAHQIASVGPSGDDGAATIAEAASRCEEDQKQSSGLFSRRSDALRQVLGQYLSARDFDRQVRGSRSLSSRTNGAAWLIPERPHRTWDAHHRWSWNKSVRGRATFDLQTICATYSYLAPSQIESKMRCLKESGERIASRDPDRQTA